MRVVKQIPVHAIRMDRHALEPRTLDLAQYLDNGGEVPPIHVQITSSGFRICDGRHRVTAHKLLGREKITARYSTLPERRT